MAHNRPQSGGDPIADRRVKLDRLRTELNAEPYGQRVDDLMSLADARNLYNPDKVDDDRAATCISGRIVLLRNIGNLIFMTLRDSSGDLQIGISKKSVDRETFSQAKLTDRGDIVVVRGRVGITKSKEITVWVEPIEENQPPYALASKSLVPPPEKWKGLKDPELRYRQRYVDMYTNPDVIRTFQARSRIVRTIRHFMEGHDFVEVETPMLQSIAGGAAARPFVTHHNALDIDLFLRIAPELYLKRLLVGGIPRVYEINRNFRNEGVDRRHNPEFTMLEAYHAFGDYQTMMELTEAMIRKVALDTNPEGKIEWGGEVIDYNVPFRRVHYGELFENTCGFSMRNFDQVRHKARELGIHEQGVDSWIVVNEVFETVAEKGLVQPTFIMDYPSAISPLTRPHTDDPTLCERWDLFIGEMEIGPAYTELNDPDIQDERFRQQLEGADEELNNFRTLDEDFLHALRVGMPPAGGLGIGIDRVVMLMTGHRHIRDVILFPLMRPLHLNDFNQTDEEAQATQTTT